jgi:hypothetical protein
LLQVTHNAIEQFISNTHSEWFSSVDATTSRHLQANLLQQDKSAGGAPAARCLLPGAHCPALI